MSRARWMPLVGPDLAVLPETLPAVDRVAHLRGSQDADPITHLPRLPQRRQGECRFDTLPPDLFDGEDEVDPSYPLHQKITWRSQQAPRGGVRDSGATALRRQARSCNTSPRPTSPRP